MPRKHVLCLQIASGPSIPTDRHIQHLGSLTKTLGEKVTVGDCRFALAVAQFGRSSSAVWVGGRFDFFSVVLLRPPVEPGTNSTCPAFFFATRVHGHRKHLPRAFHRAWWCRRPRVDRASFLAHQGRRACRQSARRGRRRRTLLGTLAPPCRWSKNETRGWWLGGDCGKMVAKTPS